MVPGCTVVPCAASVEVFARVGSGAVSAAVIPIENSLAGSVAEHLDLLLASDVFIQREFPLRIQHNLIAAPGVKLAELTRVFSHPVALDQCRDFFRRHRKIEAAPFYDTAGAVKHVVGNQLQHTAAIAGRQAAAEYGGRILAARPGGRQAKLHPLLSDYPQPAAAGRRQQDLAGLFAEERARRTVQSAERVCPPRPRSVQNRVAPGARPPLGVPFLRGCPPPSAARQRTWRTRCATCARSPTSSRCWAGIRRRGSVLAFGFWLLAFWVASPHSSAQDPKSQELTAKRQQRFIGAGTLYSW